MTVTPVLGGAIRMVKLFGWEDRMSESIDRKRRAELNAIWKLKMFNLLNHIIKYVHSFVRGLVDLTGF